MTDCKSILEMLDVYALGAHDQDEAEKIERHVADCVRCWEELNKAQETAALLAISVPLHDAPPRVFERIISQAQRDVAGIRTEPKPAFFDRFRLRWPMAAGALGAVSLGAIVFSAALQMQVHDLRDENNSLKSEVRAATFALQTELESTDNQLAEQQTLVAVLSDEGKREVEVTSASQELEASAYYTWSPTSRKGFVQCENLPALPPGKVYQLWVTSQGKAYPATTFYTQDGWCQAVLDLSFLDTKPSGIGISVEQSPGGMERPTDGWLLYSHFPDR